MKILVEQTISVKWVGDSVDVRYINAMGEHAHRVLYTGDEFTIAGLNTLMEAPPNVEAAIHGALALEGD